MDNRIVEVVDRAIGNYWGREIRGLNIFHVNQVAVPPENDPRIHLMIELMHKSPCSVLIGYLGVQNMGGNLEELTGSYSQAHAPERVPFGCYLAGFYGLNQSPDDPRERPHERSGYYFPGVPKEFWALAPADDDLDLRYLMEYDAVAAFFGEPIHAVDLPEFTTKEAWIDALVQIVDLVVTTVAEGYHIDLYARDKATLESIDPAIEVVCDAIRESAWYIENKDKLVWDDMCLCLAFPEEDGQSIFSRLKKPGSESK